MRQNSFSREEIPWQAHVRWLREKLRSPQSRLWILEQDSAPVGQIRFEAVGDEIEIHYSIASEHRGNGLGARLLQISAERACAVLRGKRLVGVTFRENTASGRAFERAGFANMGTFEHGGHLCTRYERACGPADPQNPSRP